MISKRSLIINKLLIPARLDGIYDGVKTIQQLRERLKKFTENNSVWAAVEKAHIAADLYQESLNELEAVIRKVGGKK